MVSVHQKHGKHREGEEAADERKHSVARSCKHKSTTHSPKSSRKRGREIYFSLHARARFERHRACDHGAPRNVRKVPAESQQSERKREKYQRVCGRESSEEPRGEQDGAAESKYAALPNSIHQ